MGRVSGQHRPEDLIYLADGPRGGDTLIAPSHSGQLVVSPVQGEVPRVDRELLYSPTGEKTKNGMRIYALVVAGRMSEGRA